MLNPKYNRLRIQEILISISLFIDSDISFRFKFTDLETIVTNEKLLGKVGLTFDVIAIIKEEGKAQTINIKSTG